MIFAVVPAAGKSDRMGRPKLSLPLGDRTVIEHVIAALQNAGIEHILVIIGPHVAELVPLAENAGAHVCRLPKETPDMRATVEAGLRWLHERFHPVTEDAWLLVPGDHPTLDPEVVRSLVAARKAHPDCSIFVPIYLGNRGHPTLIGWEHVAGIRAHPAGDGLNAYFRAQERMRCDVPVTTADVLLDLDTPEDYERLKRRAGRR